MFEGVLLDLMVHDLKVCVPDEFLVMSHMAIDLVAMKLCLTLLTDHVFTIVVIAFLL